MSEKELLEQIKKLQEENECQKKQLDHLDHKRRVLYEKYKEVAEENEKLRRAVVGLAIERFGV